MEAVLTHLITRDEYARVLEQSLKFCRAPVVPHVVDAVPNFLLILNEHRQVVFANLPVVRLLGLQMREQCYGKRPGELLDCQHAGDGAYGCGTSEHCSTCGAARAIRASEIAAGSVAECCIHRRSVDHMLELRVATSGIDVEGDRYTVLALSDIAHEKRRRVMERIFFHDVLNTIGALAGYAQLLESETAGRLDDLTKPIMRLSGLLTEEVCSQRDLGAAENHELVVRREAVNSREVLEELAVTYRSHPVSEGKTISIASPAVSATLNTDRRLLLRVLGNMLKNAVEATPQGSAVTLCCQRDGGSNIVFSVHNDGAIPREIQLQIFHRSFSTKGASRGLGTYSMKLLGETYLGGEIAFTSTPQHGTTFTARFPATFPPPNN